MFHCIWVELFDWAAFLLNTWDLSSSFATNHQQLIKKLLHLCKIKMLCYSPKVRDMFNVCYMLCLNTIFHEFRYCVATHLSPLKTEPGNQHGWRCAQAVARPNLQNVQIDQRSTTCQGKMSVNCLPCPNHHFKQDFRRVSAQDPSIHPGPYLKVSGTFLHSVDGKKHLHARHSTGACATCRFDQSCWVKNCAVTLWCHAQVLRKHTQQLEPNSISSSGLDIVSTLTSATIAITLLPRSTG